MDQFPEFTDLLLLLPGGLTYNALFHWLEVAR